MSETEQKSPNEKRNDVVALARDIERTFTELDELLTRMPPELLTKEDYQTWENARSVVQSARALRKLLIASEALFSALAQLPQSK